MRGIVFISILLASLMGPAETHAQPRRLEALIAQLRSGNAGERHAAATQLGQLGDCLLYTSDAADE